MSATVRKNIRAALSGLPDGDRLDLSRIAARWIEDTDRPQLAQEQIAIEALVQGRPLDGCHGPYGSVAQCRAFAAGALRGAIYEMACAYRQMENDAVTAARVKRIEDRIDYFRTSARAAWRASGMDGKVPFQDPKTLYHGRTEWAD